MHSITINIFNLFISMRTMNTSITLYVSQAKKISLRNDN